MDADVLQEHEQRARAYLAAEFGADAPAALTPLATFDEAVLEGDGPVTLFSFESARGQVAPAAYIVVAGRTQPNYYPDWGLDAEDVFSLHVGTRFMLVMEIQQAVVTELPPGFRDELVRSLGTVAPGEPVEDFRVAAAFRLEQRYHFVCRLRLGGEELYVLGGELPLGIYRRIELPPHVMYRLHLGKVIRMEED